MELKARIHEWVQTHKNEMLQTLSEFVQIPSVRDDATAGPGQPFGAACREILDAACRKAEKMGLICKAHEGYCLEVRCQSETEKEIGIIAHADVVPISGDWIFPPFCGKIDGDIVLGRGAHDNKCACVMGLYLLKMFKALGIRTEHGVRLILGANEESGMEDMRYYKEHVKIPVVSLVPDSLYPANYAQKWGLKGEISLPMGADILFMEGGADFSVPGSAECIVALSPDQVKPLLVDDVDVHCEAAPGGTKLTAKGIATHAANPWLGKSALLILCRALQKLPLEGMTTKKSVETLCTMTSDYYGALMDLAASDEHTGPTTIVFGRTELRSGRLWVKYVMRNCLAVPKAEVIAKFGRWCDANGVRIETQESTNPVFFDPNDPRIGALQNVWYGMTGRDDKPFATGGNTYSRVVPDAITFGIIGYCGKRPEYIPKGTGSAHEANECIDIAVVQFGIEIYAQAILALDALV